MSDQAVENEIQAKGLTAPRITHQQIEGVIVGEDYHLFEGTTLTVCCLKLANGYAVQGESACVSSENFDAAVGRMIARENAKRKIWELEGYLLRERLSV